MDVTDCANDLFFLTRFKTCDDIIVRWDVGLNQKNIAWFYFPKLEMGEVKLAVGDELRLRYRGELHEPWEAVGHVIKIPNSRLYFNYYYYYYCYY